MNKEIIKLIIKSECLDNFFYIFPALASLKVDDGISDSILTGKISKIIENKEYYSLFEVSLSRDEIKQVITDSIGEIFLKLNEYPEDGKYSLYEDLPNVVANINVPRLTNLDTSYTDNLTLNSFFVENYIRLSLNKTVALTDALTIIEPGDSFVSQSRSRWVSY